MGVSPAGGGLAPESLAAQSRLPARTRLCSHTAGWRSLLLRSYAEDLQTEAFTTQATPDYLIVLVVDGVADVESRRGPRWVSVRKVAGMLGTIRPGEEATLRWRGERAQRTLQMHLPGSLLDSVREDYPARPGAVLPNLHGERAPFLENMLRTLADALARGLPDLFAEQGATFIAAHLLGQSTDLGAHASQGAETRRLAHVEAYLHDRLSAPITLAQLAAEAGLSRHHLIRLFRKTYGETPFRRLTRIRMEWAARALQAGGTDIAEIAAHCCYENATHFSAAFRRLHGLSPSEYRNSCK